MKNKEVRKQLTDVGMFASWALIAFVTVFLGGFALAGAAFQKDAADGWCENEGGKRGTHNFCVVDDKPVDYPEWLPVPKNWNFKKGK